MSLATRVLNDCARSAYLRSSPKKGTRMTRTLTSVRARLTSVCREERGATMVEYALVITFIAMVALFGAVPIGTAVLGFFNQVATYL